MKKIILTLLLVFAFKINAQVWQVVAEAEMPHPVYGGEAVVIDSLIYVVGGFSDLINSNVNLIQEFNPQNNSWRIVDSMNTMRYGFVAGNYQDSLVVTGGVSLTLLLDNTLEIWNLINHPYIFDLDSNFTRTFATGLVHNNNLYVFGGVSINLLSTYMFRYNFPNSDIDFSNNFGFLISYPFQQISALANNSIYLFGGVFIGTSRAIYGFGTETTELNLLDSELMQSRAGGRAVTINDSSIYIIGGFNESQLALSSVEIFKVEDSTITNGPELNFERSELMAVRYNNSIYTFGGKNDLGTPVSEVEKLDLVTSIDYENIPEANEFILHPNYPNPFNPSTLINFYIPSRSQVQLKIYNLAGEEIIQLVNEEMQEGTHQVLFDASKENTTGLSSGVYFYKLIAFNFSTQNTYIDTRKMLLLK
ncbi:MAG TPA: T9SS type A sorting domain-containing protein [Ignavibacteriaceae bacterium]|nr:T9SS type A sorting domain-containing protein [Ignavibacteriaceae bacterium]